MSFLQQCLCVALGGGFGALSRYVLVGASQSFFGTGFPYGVLIVNAFGSGLMGLLVGLLTFQVLPDPTAQGSEIVSNLSSNSLRLTLGTGFLGGFTTFSAFSLDALMLWRSGQFGLGLLYVCGTVLMCLFAVMLGWVIAKQL